MFYRNWKGMFLRPDVSELQTGRQRAIEKSIYLHEDNKNKLLFTYKNMGLCLQMSYQVCIMRSIRYRNLFTACYESSCNETNLKFKQAQSWVRFHKSWAHGTNHRDGSIQALSICTLRPTFMLLKASQKLGATLCALRTTL